MGGDVAADALGLLDRGCDLLPTVAAGGQRRPRLANAAGREDLEVVGASSEILSGAATHLVDAVECRNSPSMTVAGRHATRRTQQPRAGNGPGLDGFTQVDVQEVLLGHQAHSGRTGGE